MEHIKTLFHFHKVIRNNPARRSHYWHFSKNWFSATLRL